jgi:hypothetical protein
MMSSIQSEAKQEEALQGDLQKLLRDLAERSDPQSLYLRARAMHRLGRRREALALSRQASLQAPGSSLIESFLLFLESTDGRSSFARRRNRLGKTIDGGMHVAPQVWHARLEWLQHNRTEAHELITALLDRHPKNALVIETAALFRYAAKDLAGSLALLSRLPSPTGKEDVPREQLRLMASLLTGRLADAREAYHRIGKTSRLAWLLSLWPYRALITFVAAVAGGAAVALASWWLAALVSIGSIFVGIGIGWYIFHSTRSLAASFVGALVPWVGILVRQALD